MDKVLLDIKDIKNDLPQASWGKQTWLKHLYCFIVCSVQQGVVGDPGVGQNTAIISFISQCSHFGYQLV